MRRYCFIVVFSSFIASTYSSVAQNLIQNGSFEQKTECPHDITAFELKNVKYWFQPTNGSVDYYNKCNKNGPVGIPRNCQGYQYPRSGNAYIGMILYEKGGYREYISTKLTYTLHAKTEYCVRLYISLAEISSYAISDIQVLFSSSKIKMNTNKRINSTPQLSYSENKPITDTANWVEISWRYIAKGDEEYLTIGNFNKNSHCTVTNVKSSLTDITRLAYYYIDDICVSEMKGDSACDCTEGIRKDIPKKSVTNKDTIEPKQLVIKANENITLGNVSFESDEADLLPTSFTELDQLVTYLQKNNTTQIEISGYTDNTGVQEKNLQLSEARAKAVGDYLMSKGIDKGRVSSKGYGSANPIASNYTEEGKAKNRRVEFKIIGK